MRRGPATLAVVVALCAVASVHAGCAGDDRRFRASAEQGELDLRGWRPTVDGPVTLDGEWALYWKQILSPADLHVARGQPAPEPDAYLEVPGTWNATLVDGERVGGRGFATLTLAVVHDLPAGTPLAFRFGDMSTAWSLFVDGEPVAHAGTVGQDRASSVACYDPLVASFEAPADRFELVLQMSNYHHEKGGPWNAIGLGDESTVRRIAQRRLASDMLLFGAILIMGFYYLVLYLLRRRDQQAALYFGLGCLVMALRALVVGEVFYTDLFPDAWWELQVKLEYTANYLIIPLFLLYFRALFPDEIPRWATRAVLALHALLVLQVLATSGYAFTHTMIAYRPTGGVIAWATLCAIVLATIRRREGAWIVLAGFVAFFVGGINDLLHTAQVIQTGYLMSLGLLVFLLSQAFLLSLRFSLAYRSVERLSKRLQALDRVKDEFLARTSHELRTPLNGIHGLAESMLEGLAGPVSTAQRENLELIAHSGRRLAYLVNDILDFSRLRNEDVELNRRDVDLHAVLAVVLPLHRYAAEAKGLEIIPVVPDSIPAVYADEQRLEQILHNLIGNAVKFTDRGSVTVLVTAPEGCVEISIADTGVGIPEDKLDVVFQDFEQLERTRDRRFGGTGLGLSITRHLVQLHGSEIEVESRPGEGSRFRFTLPVASDVLMQTVPAIPPADAVGDEFVGERRATVSGALYLRDHDAPTGDLLGGEGFPTLERLEEVDPARPRYRVLVVDDDPVGLRVAMQHLAGEEYLVLPATSGPEALGLLREREVDLVVLDLMMPRMSGFEVCRRIREHHPATELPVIMLTARDQLGDVVQGFDVGANDYLTKPFSRAELLARVRLHLSVVLANVDPVTGIGNRRAFDHALELEWRRAQRQGSELSLVKVDIDHFQAFNEHYGQRAGDDCLRRVAHAIRGSVQRAGDVVGRYDGEEFGAILPATPKDGAGVIAERIRDRVSELEIPHAGSEILRIVTVSAGFAATRPARGTKPGELVERADEALHRAKKMGRDRVVGV